MNTYQLNLKNSAITEFENYDFNSIATDGVDYYGASDNGIFFLSGETDNGTLIASKIRTGTHDFETSFLKRYLAVYLGVISEAAISFKIVPDDNIAYSYALDNDGQPQAHTVKINTGKGMKTRYITVELTNTDGGYFEISSIEFLFDILSRRVYGGR